MTKKEKKIIQSIASYVTRIQETRDGLPLVSAALWMLVSGHMDVSESYIYFASKELDAESLISERV